jgi:hypothetical protein
LLPGNGLALPFVLLNISNEKIFSGFGRFNEKLTTRDNWPLIENRWQTVESR